MTTYEIIALSLACAAACSAGNGDGEADAAPDGGGDTETEASCDAPGDCPLLSGVAFVQLGAPHPGYPVLADLEAFGERLFVSAALNPLGSFGAAVASTADGESFENAVVDATSQGFLRIRGIDGALYIPDGDPNGYDPSFVWVSSDGESFDRTTVPGAVHTFDVASYGGALVASNGMMSGDGSLCAYDAGDASWPEVEATPYSRLKHMAVFADRLFVSKRVIGVAADYLVWDCAVEECDGEAVDAIDGEANTWRWFASGAADLLYWSYATSGVGVLYTADGESWEEAASLGGEFVSELVELDGNVYALGHSGLWGSSDGVEFELIVEAPSSTTFGPVAVDGGYNAEATASMEVFDGHIWCGSSNDGHLYRVE